MATSRRLTAGSSGSRAPLRLRLEDYGFTEFYRSVDAVLLGSRTYEQSRTFGVWPYPDKPCWVFSAREHSSVPLDVNISKDDPSAIVAELDRRGMACAWLVGGGALAASFRSAGLITQLVLSVMPVVSR